MDLGGRLIEVGSDAACRARWPGGRVVAATAAFARLAGVDPVGRTLEELLGAPAASALGERLSREPHAWLDDAQVAGDGGARRVAIEAFRTEDAVDVFVRDADAEDAARHGRRGRAIVDALPDLLFVMDARTGVYTDFHAPAPALLFTPPSAFLGKRADEVLPGDVGREAMAALRSAVETRSLQRIEYALDLGGVRREFEARVVPCGETEALSIVREITDRRRAEQALADEKERLAVTLSSIGDGVIATDAAGRVVLVNPVAAALTGFSQEAAAGLPLEAVFRTMGERSREPVPSPVERVLASGGTVALANDTVLVARDGTERVIADSAAPIRDRAGRAVGVVLVFRDRTEKERVDRELRRLDKLESIALLAGGIAHDFNNLLAAILANLSLAREGVTGEVAEMLALAEAAARRATGLTRQLLTFSGKHPPVKRATALGPLVREWAAFSLSGSATRCEVHVAPDLWPVFADEVQLGQAVSNLVKNASQAMGDAGTVRIDAANARLEGDGALGDGPYVALSVTDSGGGIRPENLPRIFDPFFTTKERGRGLGLATTHAVVRAHGGRIGVATTPGRTTFTIHLPAVPDAVPTEPARPVLGSGSGRVLVMDDEPLVRNAVGRMLEAIGYEAVPAADGAEALAIYERALGAGSPFDAVIADLTVAGGMGGAELAARLLRIDREARVVASTGYSADADEDLRARGFRASLSKPYRIEELAATMAAVLGGA